MTQLEHIEAIEKRLWNAADTLRANSNYASNEYFLPVMGLIFLRHAYNRFLALKDNILKLIFRNAAVRREFSKRISLRKARSFFSPKLSSTPLSVLKTATIVLRK